MKSSASSWSRQFRRTFLLLLGETLRSRLAVGGFAVLALLGFFMGLWVNRSGEALYSALLLFTFNFTIICSGDFLSREFRSRRAVLLLSAGTRPSVLFSSLCAAWGVVYLLSSWAFCLLAAGLDHAAVAEDPRFLTLMACLPLFLLPLLALTWLVSTVVPTWLNVAAVWLALLVVRIVGGSPELFGPSSTAARWVFRIFGAEQPFKYVGGQLALVDSHIGLFLLRSGLKTAGFVVAGTLLVEWPRIQSRLGRWAG